MVSFVYQSGAIRDGRLFFMTMQTSVDLRCMCPSLKRLNEGTYLTGTTSHLGINAEADGEGYESHTRRVVDLSVRAKSVLHLEMSDTLLSCTITTNETISPTLLANMTALKHRLFSRVFPTYLSLR